jgi:hypothetical protein
MARGKFDPVSYIAVSFLSFLFFMIALVTNHWGLIRGSEDAGASCVGVGCSIYLPEGVRANYGLWKVELKYSPTNYDDYDRIDSDCKASLQPFVSSDGISTDLSHIYLPGNGSDCEKFNTVRAFVFLAMIFSGIAVILQAVVSSRENSSTSLTAIAAFFSAMAAIFGMIAMAIYGSVAQDKHDAIQNIPQDFGFSFWCNAIGGWPISFLAVIAFLVGSQADDEHKPQAVPQ